MSDVKKVLTLVACGCICLMVATSASAEFTGTKAVNKTDPETDLLCVQGTGNEVIAQGFDDFGLTICNVYTTFSNGADRMLSIGNADIQAFRGNTESIFFQHSLGNGNRSPSCIFIPIFPDLICDTFVTIGVKCSDGADATQPDPDFNCDPSIPNLPPPDDACGDNPLQLDWFNCQDGPGSGCGHIWGGWFNGDPPGGNGDAGNDPPNQNLQVLFLQTAVRAGDSVSGTATAFWRDPNPPNEIIGEDIVIECAAKCTPGQDCTDGDGCTENDECINGNCVGTPVDCTGLDDDCNEGVCVPAPDGESGTCEANPINEGGPCDDGNPCTSPDTCNNGVCEGTGCEGDDDCNDDNPCTTDICGGDGCCTNTPDCTSDADCDDGIDCTVDSCDTGSGCCSNTPDNGACDDGNECTDNTCDADSGCTSTDNNDGCNDGDQCTNNDTCDGGSCVGEDKECPPGADCNPDNGECEFCQTDADCDDGLACNGAEACDPGTGCQDGDPIDCSGAGDQCNDGVCVEPGECVQEPANEGGPCDDGNNCTNDDTCSDGDCDGVPKDCPDGEVCDPSDGECVEVSDFLDIIPGKCPNLLRRNGLGYVKISLLGTADLDAADVDVSSLILRNVQADLPPCDGEVRPQTTPRPHVRDRATPFLGALCDCHSRRKDGTDDLDMKFKLAEIVNELCLSGLAAGVEVRLELSGVTFGGQPIRAADCVILGRNLGPNP